LNQVFWNGLNRTDAVANPVGSASYIIDVSGSTYRMINQTTGQVDYQSTNASAVIQPAILANTTIQFKTGNYAIDYLLPVSVSAVHFVGSGWGTEFTIGANGGFNISSATALNDISFENIRWMDSSGGTGAGLAAYGITSAMPAQQRISHFKFAGNRVDYFRKSGTIFLNLTNLEASTINNNYFAHTTTAFIDLRAYRYTSGNNQIFGNVFYAGYDAPNENIIRISCSGGNTTYYSSSGAVASWGNQFYGESSYRVSVYAWNLTIADNYASINGPNSQNDMYETVNPLWSNATASIYKIAGGIFANNRIYQYGSGFTCFTLSNSTYKTSIHDNYVNMTVGECFLWDGWVSGSYQVTEYNEVYDNHFTYAPLITGSGITRVRDNGICNPIGYVAKWKAADGNVAAYNGYASTFTNTTTYTVRTCPVYFNVTGGTGVNITINDQAGNQMLVDSTGLFWFYLDIGWKITCTYTTAPTPTVYFD
jgi:hypothetical protein